MRKLFLQVAPGLEKLLERELQQLCIPLQYTAGSGGAWAFGSDSTLWQIALRSRVCEAIRMAVAEPFHCAHEATMLRSVREAPWADFLPADVGLVHVKVRVDKVSRLQHTGMIENLIRRGLEVSEQAPEKEAKAPFVHVYLKHDKCYLSVDATGPLAHRRYHTATGLCPLRETLAAAAVVGAKVERHLQESPRGIVLWDPFCGSGTILLEALSIVLGHPSGSPKIAYPFLSFPSHNQDAYEEFVQSIRLEPHPRVCDLSLVGTDKDASQIQNADHNFFRLKRRMPRDNGAEEPEIPSDLKFVHTGALEFGEDMLQATDKDVVIVSNLPYGQRSGSTRYNSKMYKDFGAFVRKHKHRIRGLYCIVAKGNFQTQTHLEWRTELRFSHGGIPVEMLRWNKDRQ